MYSLLIVDDEAPIADGLGEVMQGLSSPELDVHTAYSGAEAIRVLEGTRIDIVLSDIRMPEMDGLQLLEEIRGRWPRCRVIFLTGHADFDSVYAAIKHDGVSYLLKTDGYDAVIAAVRKAAADIEDAVKAADMLMAANERMAEAKGVLREKYLNGIIRGRFCRRDISREQFEELEIPLSAEKPVLILAGRVENLPPGLGYSGKIRRMYGVQAVAGHFLSGQSASVCLIEEMPRLIWLLQPVSGGADPAAWRAFLTFVKGVAASIQDAAEGSLGLILSFVLDEGPAEWPVVADRLADLGMLLDYRIGRDSGLLLARRAAPERPAASIGGASTSRVGLEHLTEALELGDRERFFGRLEAITAGFASQADIHDLATLETYHAVALMLLTHINRRSLIEKVAARIGLHKLMNAESHGTWTAARAYLEGMGRILFELRQGEKEELGRTVIERVKAFIAEHVLEPDRLTLASLADLVHLNPSYLSRLFRQDAGVKLSDCIAETRIKKAKEMLEDGEAKIHWIAAALGYGTAANFTRFFKKSVSLTPQEYRDRRAGR